MGYFKRIAPLPVTPMRSCWRTLGRLTHVTLQILLLSDIDKLTIDVVGGHPEANKLIAQGTDWAFHRSCRATCDPLSVALTAERPAFFTGWNDTHKPPPVGTTVQDLQQCAIAHRHDAQTGSARGVSPQGQKIVGSPRIGDEMIGSVVAARCLRESRLKHQGAK